MSHPIKCCSALCVLQANQSTTPQPVEVCVCCLRATRDKLPRGLYTVSVALHSRLGGPALAWRSKKEQQQHAVSTEPVEHRGRFCDTDLHLNQSLFMVRIFYIRQKQNILTHPLLTLMCFKSTWKGFL